MTLSPLVSVIIPNYNYGVFLLEAVESVFAQTYKNIEIIVVDDGSTDHSIDILTPHVSHIKLVVQKNSGVSIARNKGLEKATGDYVCFLDSDDVWLPKKIELQLKELNSNPRACVYTGIELFGEDNTSPVQVYPKYRGNLIWHFLRNPGRSIVLLGCSTAILPTEIARRVGGFDSSFSFSADWDFFRRVAEVTDLEFVNECLVRYRQHDGSMSNRSITKYYEEMPMAFRHALSSWLSKGEVSRLSAQIAWYFFVIRIFVAFLKAGDLKLFKGFALRHSLFVPKTKSYS